jgi:hypothetical protein
VSAVPVVVRQPWKLVDEAVSVDVINVSVVVIINTIVGDLTWVRPQHAFQVFVEHVQTGVQDADYD